MLYDRMRNSDVLLMFFLKTQGFKRGYRERSQVDVGGEMNIKLTWGDPGDNANADA